MEEQTQDKGLYFSKDKVRPEMLEKLRALPRKQQPPEQTEPQSSAKHESDR